jgi:phage gpG-like protein
VLSLNAKVNPFTDITKLIARLNAPSSTDTEPVTQAIRDGFAENFAGEQTGAGLSWVPLRPFTIAERTRLGYGGAHPILVRTGSLRSSYTAQGGDSVNEFTPDGSGWVLAVGSQHPNALKHEQGEGRVPARPVTILSPQRENTIADRVFEMIERIERQTAGTR